MIHLASRIEAEWLVPDSIEVVHLLDGERVRAERVERYGALVLGAHPVQPDPDRASELLVERFCERGLSGENLRVARRAHFAGVELEIESIARSALSGRTEMPDVRIVDWLSWEQRKQLENGAPSQLEIPSGRSVKLDYREDGSVVLSAKLQELFGLEESPKIGRDRTPVTIDLLAPNGRSVQMTSDLKSFWKTTYPEVRKELRGRYPKHPWPEDPWNAEATAKTKKQLRRSDRE